MRAVIFRLRSLRLRSNILPLVLAALVLRAMIPAGFMPGSAPGVTLTASLCSALPGQSETIEIEGEHSEPHCEYCVAAPLGAAPALAVASVSTTAAHTQPSTAVSQTGNSLLARAQTARAPPPA
jgi:hypothetical protein